MTALHFTRFRYKVQWKWFTIAIIKSSKLSSINHQAIKVFPSIFAKKALHSSFSLFDLPTERRHDRFSAHIRPASIPWQRARGKTRSSKISSILFIKLRFRSFFRTLCNTLIRKIRSKESFLRAPMSRSF